MIYQPLDNEQEKREIAQTRQSLAQRRAVLFAQLMSQLNRTDYEIAVVTGTHITQL
ncbi:MAG: hypothetical protein ACYDBJ_25585 [Aggregatilineales bacterium]